MLLYIFGKLFTRNYLRLMYYTEAVRETFHYYLNPINILLLLHSLKIVYVHTATDKRNLIRLKKQHEFTKFIYLYIHVLYV